MRDAGREVALFRELVAAGRLAGVVALMAAAVACGGGTRGHGDTAAVGATATADSAQAVRIPAAELEESASALVAFLRGESPFERVLLADSVTLVVSPEGGSARATFRREALREPARWAVQSGGQLRSFAPPPGLGDLVTRVGHHLNCTEQSLASRAPDLAGLPHVGTMLRHSPDASCLQTWNVTFVFDSIARPPRLVAVIYDQWEF